ncbi:ceramide synthase 4-like [Sinocyclocheilus anshuiensis]|uniref:ceramide synthase 4-like n=1 Tax=Sinocyclocheilus anshuiensis TaxID=1608454 RepID=UPI0007B9736A|nr:PREDICTED: ceramide synthase 4-like [Sinocyclocheilus anshuiensis]
MDRLEELVNQWIWRQDFWLPPGVTWKDIAEGTVDGGRHPVPRDLLISLPLALGFIALRFVFERVVALPLSRRLGVRDRVRVCVTPVPKLEEFYLQKKQQPSQSDLLVLEKHCGLSQRQIQTWLRQRRNQDRPGNTRKFCEASWRFVFYLMAFSAGLVSLINVSISIMLGFLSSLLSIMLTFGNTCNQILRGSRGKKLPFVPDNFRK